ncbi:MAG: hypothetical protein ACP5HX_10905 [Thermoproteota archaeon]
MKSKKYESFLIFVITLTMLFSLLLAEVNGNETSFQTNEYNADQSSMNFLPGNFKANISIVYMNDYNQPIESGISSWKTKGYRVYVMVSASHDWTGSYVEGKFDGKTHYDEVQTFSDGKYATIGQGYYMVPTRGWTNYLKAMVNKAAKSGAEGIVLEEPEFWISACYSPSFKNLWERFYGFPWIDPRFNETIAYLSRKLMSLLYYNLEKEVFDHVKEINNSMITLLATHSPLNYAEIGISTPFALTLNISSLDGYIAQVWSFSAQYPIYGERLIFEHAFLEYSYFQNLVEGTNKTLFLLMDPKSDEPNHPWNYYRKDYEKLVVAATMINCTNFELLPWPERVFGDPTIPKDYVYELVNVFNTLSSVPPLHYSSPIVGIPISDSYLWQSNSQVIYLLTLPLLRSGVRVELFPIERAENENFLKKFSVIILNYESWHPSSSKQQEGIIKWLRNGGKLIFFGSVNNYSKGYLIALLKLLEVKNPRIFYSNFATAKNSSFAFLGDSISLSSSSILLWNATELQSQVGEVVKDSSSPNGKARVAYKSSESGALVYGQYIDLPKGSYIASYLMKVKDNNERRLVATIDISSNIGQKIIKSKDIYASDFNSSKEYQWFELPFVLNSSESKVEFRVWFRPGFTDLYVAQVKLTTTRVDFLSINGSNFSSIYCDNAGNSVVFFKKFYNGSFIFLGIPLTYFNSARDSFLLNAIYNSLKFVGFKSYKKSWLIIKRGFVIILYSFSGTRLSGKYINLFSPRLEEVIDPTFSSDQYALLLLPNSTVKVNFVKSQAYKQQFVFLVPLLVITIAILLFFYFLLKVRKRRNVFLTFLVHPRLLHSRQCLRKLNLAIPPIGSVFLG